MKTGKYILLFLAGIAIWGLVRMSGPVLLTAKAQPDPASPQPTASQPARPHAGFPKTLAIPSLSVNVPVEPVGLDSEKRMAIPRDPSQVAWYAFGARPGDGGNAVLAGHYDTPTGAPSVFYKLQTLVPGDSVRVTDDAGQTWEFRVKKVSIVPNDRFPIADVFGPTALTRLNLITCGGTYNRTTREYPDRVVVYSEFFSLTRP